MLHIETGDRHVRQSSHRSLERALRAATIASRDDTPVRVVADARTLADLILSGEVYRTAQGEIVDAGQTWAIVEST